MLSLLLLAEAEVEEVVDAMMKILDRKLVFEVYNTRCISLVWSVCRS